MNSVADCYTLSNGVAIPCVGFGTWQAENGDAAYNAVSEAIQAGYRHIDTAAAYGNEESVGAAVNDSAVLREDLFVTSKLWNTDHGYEETRRSFASTMEKLQLDYLDLYLIHWPNPKAFRSCWEEKNAESWRAMEEFYREGKIRAIGVSNFMPHHMDALMKTAKVTPMVNQIRLCPGEVQQDAVAYCKDHGILLEAYSPLGGGLVFESPIMQELAQKYGRTVSQLCLGWCLQSGYLPLPKSVTPERIKENANVFGFTISPEDMETIANLPGCGAPANPDQVDF